MLINKCTLLFSSEDIEDQRYQWTMKEPMNFHRHLPGVGTHNDQIFVIGGTNDSWEAQPIVEAYEPATDRNVLTIFGYIYLYICKNLCEQILQICAL